MRSLLLAPLMAVVLLAGCSDPGTSTGSADVVTTGPEPGAEVATTPTTPVAATSPTATTPAEAEKPKTKDEASTESDEKTKDRATPTRTPTARNAAKAQDAPEPTIAPATTLKPKEPTDPVDLAFARQMLHFIAAGNGMAQSVEARTQRAEFRALATKIIDDLYDPGLSLTTWGDVLGPVLSQAVDKQYVGPDTRLLGASTREMKQSRAILLAGEEPFTDVKDDRFDAVALEAMIEHHESGIILSGGTIQTGGSPRFRRLAEKFERTQRKELEELRALERDL
ncbi:MAG: DUF305 domain-containing protein [Solirubrobacteraceae bacterium]|nr:DUF305 domain-containing protein [Solirubrobacteraceae bacterium]